MITLALNLLFIIGYVLLVGPPRAVEISANAKDSDDELHAKPIWMVILAEFILRSGIFLVIAASIEAVLGDYLYELYHLDLFLGSLILAGIIHTFSYYASYCFMGSKGHSMSRFYRLGRNFAYAIVPAFVAAGLVLVYQDINDLQYFDYQQVEIIFFITWAFFVFLGLFEALFMKRIPMGLGSVLLKRLKKS